MSLATNELIILSDLPTEDFWNYHGSVNINNSLYLVGGERNNAIDIFEPITPSFGNLNSMQTCRSSFGICQYNDCSLIVAGGYHSRCKSGNRALNATSFLYDTSTNDIKYLGNLNKPKQKLVLVNCLGAVFALGGYGKKVDCEKIVEKLNPTTDKWEIIQSKLTVCRISPRAISHNEYIYVFGGKNYQGIMQDSVEKINTLSGEVTIFESMMQIPKFSFAICKIDSDVYLIGGDKSNQSYDSTDLKNSVEVFDLCSEKFKSSKNLSIYDGRLTFDDLGL